MAESTQHKLDRVRPPRVQITYDVEIGDAIEMKELPMVVGIMADLSGKQADPKPKFKDRKFVEIDRDNFGDVMTKLTPRVAFRVDNTLAADDSKMNVELTFKSLDDFHPDQLVHQVEPLKKLMEARQKLTGLLAKMDGNDELEALLQDIVENTDGLNEIKSSLSEGEGEGEG